MTFITETVEKKASVLIVAENDLSLVTLLKQELKKYNVDIFVSPHLPNNLNRFDYFFFINKNIKSAELTQFKNKKVSYIFYNKINEAEAALEKYNRTDFKIISLYGGPANKDQIDRILWFSFSQTKEKFLQLFTLKHTKTKKGFDFSKIRLPKRKSLAIGILILIFVLHIAFIGPLFLSSFLFYKGVVNFKNENFDRTKNYLSLAESTFNFAKGLYSISRPTLLFFSLALIPDNIFDINQKTDETLNQLIVLEENGKNIIKLIINKDKTSEDRQELTLRLNQFKTDMSGIEDNLNFISQKIPPYKPFLNIKNELITSYNLVSNMNNLLSYTDSFLAKNTEKKYLLLFANNMELRPGGGFIGSFGVMTLKDFTLEDLKVYDVYDADGQLLTHVDPPEPIRNYLQQPNWFLRDSAFSPDFLENYIQAKNFLSSEMNFNDFSGSILITTTAVQNILSAFGNIYLPDFNEKVDKDNFYLKAQIYAEKNFFPGSTQKKNFLGSLIQNMLIDMDNISLKNFANGLKKSLDEKQLVLYFDDPKIQQYIDSMYWSGRLIEPKCTINSEGCTSDFIYPFDANLGVNKANFFVSRSFDLRITIDKEGKINHSFIAQFNNDSPSEAFPGGDYKNYFQLYLPKSTVIKKITKDGVLVENYDEKDDQFKKIGLFMDIKPKSITTIKVNYELTDTLLSGKAVYQLIAQKQIGSSNSDFSLEFSIPKNISFINQNFPALVKDNQIVYNTSLSTDKIFFVELSKK